MVQTRVGVCIVTDKYFCVLVWLLFFFKQSQKIQLPINHIITPYQLLRKMLRKVIKCDMIILLFANFVEIRHEIFYLYKAQGFHCLSYKLFVIL